MTVKTEKLLHEITEALFEKKAVLITGNTGVGKTFLAKQVISELEKKEYSCFPESADQSVVTEIIPCHNSVTYEDIVGGISAGTESGRMSFRYTDKILVDTIAKASEAYHEKRGTKYVLLFDDMQRSDISSLLGDAVGAVGTESEQVMLHLNSGTTVEVTPNFYIVGTYNAAETGAIPLSNELYGRFYVREILSDIEYITDDKESENAVLYDQVRNLVMNYLDMQYKTSTYEQNHYLLGHGYFDGKDTILRIKYQLIPVLKQYITEGILDSDAEEPIRLLEAACNDKKKTLRTPEKNCFSGYKSNVSVNRFIAEESTRSCSSIPIENLVGRMIDQRLLSNDTVKNRILFNKKVCYREMEVAGTTYLATLIATTLQHNKIRRGGKPTERCLYNGGTIFIDGNEHYFTGGYHPTDYVKDACWSNKDGYKLGESFGGDLVVFRIVWQYYEALTDEMSMYIANNPNDNDKKILLNYIKNEWNFFFEEFKKIEPQSFSKENMSEKEWKRIEADYNKEANEKVRKLIGQLKVLWSNPGDELTLPDGSKIILEGVDSDMSESIYREYRDAMETLDIKQMILQGPPGTSKTFSAKAFLKYMAHNCTDAELADIQIADYSQEDKYCAKQFKGKGEPDIAWDIVQFHPSYGYEDFIRGIKVSTKKDSDTIMYETVNKVLGSIAELAKKHKNTKFFLIIDEINRANLATVFGELIYGLEYRLEPVATPYAVNNNNRISIPDNLYIIGTMNTADKSIGGIDYAIRRRFLFFEQLPDETVIKTYRENLGQTQKDLNEKACKLFESVEKLFNEDYLSPEYRREDVQIGHTYFLVDSEEKLKRRFEYQIIPILKEYYKDGIVSFDVGDSTEGFAGFLNCIAGRINMTSQKAYVEKIFQDLIA